MMIVTLITFVFAHLCNEIAAATYYNESLFELDMFENAEITKEAFRAELQLVKELKNAKKALSERVALLKMSAKEQRSLWKTVLNLDSITNASVNFPTKEDFLGAKKGLVLLHETYQFDVNLLTRGRLLAKSYPLGALSFKNAHPLGLDDLLGLCRVAFSIKWYDRAIDFLRAAFKLTERLPGDKRPPDKVLAKMNKLRTDLVVLNNKNLLQHKEALTGEHKTHRYLVTDTLAKKKTQPDFLTSPTMLSSRALKSQQGRDARFRSICNGHSLVSANAKCVLLHNGNPFLRLGPFKTELISKSPYIVVFRDFILEEERQFLLEYSRPRLSKRRRADPYNEMINREAKNNEKIHKLVYKSVQCWIGELTYQKYYDNTHEMEEDHNYTIVHPNLFALTRRIELATGLNATAKYASTEYQVTNYGLGGMCEVHYDPHGYNEGVELPPHRGFKRLQKQGDMIATVMGWLDHVEAGGATAFTALGHEAVVWPERGSAAFWLNLDRKGFRDKRLLHGGCPIVKGSKWILNKWLYYFDQMWRMPCGLDSDATYESVNISYS